MKNVVGRIFAGILASALATSMIEAKADALPSVFQACHGDVAALCPDVAPETGLVGACLTQHQDKLSEGCVAARARPISSVESHVEQACRNDAAAFCSDVASGGGRISACLTEHQDKLSENCNAARVKLTEAIKSIKSLNEKNSLVSDAERREVIAELTKQLRANYVFPEVAERVAKELSSTASKVGYKGAMSKTVFANELSQDLRALSNDLHFGVSFDPDYRSDDETSNPSAAELEKQRADTARRGYGIARVERLPGNIGYLDLRFFGDTEFVGARYSAALSLLDGTDALILDLRRNDGGDASAVAYLLSHFFARGDGRHLTDIYFRVENETQQYWTSPSVGERYTKPVYVLISARTFSGGEGCAYAFQTQKRATLVGETTAGAANPFDTLALGHGFVARIPSMRAIDPVTHTNWEHVGVKPDIAVPAAQAQRTAYTAILKTLISNTNEEETRLGLVKLLADVEKGESEAPDYLLHR